MRQIIVQILLKFFFASLSRSKRKRYGYNECEKQKEAGFGIFWAKDHPMNKSLPFSSPGAEIDPVWTNEVEVEAVTNTIKLAKKNKIKKLTIHTDSVNMFNVATEKLSRWIRSGWKTSNGEPISNVVPLQALDSQIRNSGIEITWKRDHGHTEEKRNEMAEAEHFARQGSEWVRYTNGGGYQGAFEYVTYCNFFHFLKIILIFDFTKKNLKFLFIQ